MKIKLPVEALSSEACFEHAPVAEFA